MIDQYHILRYMPDPVRGEVLNIGLIAILEGQARILPLQYEEIRKRTHMLSPNVRPDNAIAFIEELASNVSNIDAVNQLLEVFDPHFRIESRRVSVGADAFIVLSRAFQELIA